MGAPREIVPPEAIAERVKQLGRRIAEDFAGKELVLVGILKGATFFLADLLRAIPSSVRYELVNVTRSSGGHYEVIELAFATRINIGGSHTLILKDICHSGVTENYLLTHLAQQGPASLDVVAMVNKPELRRVALEPRYVLLDHVPPGRLVGYGMEYQGKWGNLPGICLLDEAA
jgi:hypoxanthine phosphoribosyltransferase